MATDLSKQVTDFMKNYRAAQQQAKTFEGLHQELSDMLNDNLQANSEKGVAAKKASAATNSQPTTFTENYRNIQNALNSPVMKLYAQGVFGTGNQAQEEQKQEEPKQETKVTEEIKPMETPKATEDNDVTESDVDVIEYTYKPGDTFGQVIKNLGLNTDAGLWGENGDVEYYTKQLEEQLWDAGIWPRGERQNIPIGTTIRLRRRGQARQPRVQLS